MTMLAREKGLERAEGLKAKSLSSESTAAATGFVVPVLAPSSILSTLLRCALSTPCPSSDAATLKTGSNAESEVLMK